jgi:DNA invertase Pin-like site-specific DNA recombinase
VIAKLDRLSRDAHFLLGLQKAEVEFVCVDMPEANKLTIGLLAIVAQHEREQISARTKAALAAAKARGVSLGGWKGDPKVSTTLGRQALTAASDAFGVRS